MIKIGITGGIGSGKSIVSKIFEVMGTAVYNSDQKAKQLMNGNEIIRRKLTAKFGEKIYLNSGLLNKKLLASIIFTKSEHTKFVNNTVHPVIIEDFRKWTEKHDKSKIIVKEAALLIESNAYKDLDIIITVFAPLELRIKRVMLRDGMKRSQVLDRIKKQLPEEEKMKIADYVIVNDDKKAVLPQLMKIYNKLMN